uniref:U1 small nuclear ribonucleoprotein C-like n=1 Tax=Steinernema glaseri TaxID=37863 RepID=A0A1I8AK26_9BILA
MKDQQWIFPGNQMAYCPATRAEFPALPATPLAYPPPSAGVPTIGFAPLPVVYPPRFQQPPPTVRTLPFWPPDVTRPPPPNGVYPKFNFYKK